MLKNKKDILVIISVLLILVAIIFISYSFNSKDSYFSTDNILQNEKNENSLPDNNQNLKLEDLKDLISLNGEKINLDNYKNKYVIINFWASWCQPCRLEMPDYQKIYHKNINNPDLDILMINLNESEEKISQFLKEENLQDLPVMIDKELKVYSKLKVNGIPIMVILDKSGNAMPLTYYNGVPNYMQIGMLNEEQLQKITEILMEKSKETDTENKTENKNENKSSNTNNNESSHNEKNTDKK